MVSPVKEAGVAGTPGVMISAVGVAIGADWPMVPPSAIWKVGLVAAVEWSPKRARAMRIGCALA